MAIEIELAAIGGYIRDACSAMGWSQRELSRRSGVPQSAISRVVRGRLNAVDLDQLARLGASTGARLRLLVDAPFLVDRARQRDLVHASCIAYVATRLKAAGWQVATEVEIVSSRGPGWIDVLAFHVESRELLVIEVKTQLDDLGRIQRTLAWYERAAWNAVERLGWRPRRASGALIVLATRAVDARLIANRSLIRLGFPARAHDLRNRIANPARSEAEGPALAVIDPLSRASVWLRATVLEPSARPSRYLDYADAARTLEARRRHA